ncbi:MAG: hypothetical protein ACE5R4_03330 [Armatimonadota bacterium]
MPDQGNERERARQTAETYAIWAVVGSAITGFLGIIGGLVLYLLHPDEPGAGICLVAAALAFGLLANAMLRN